MQKRKLQVFVSSTYTDLRDERQAAVEAILRAGHIPVGMELFSTDDDFQWEVIKKWIEESDVFMLILGGRYGSVDPKTGKSYVQMEYEYAIHQRKSFFALVATDNGLYNKSKQYGPSVIEQENPKQLEEFRKFVLSRVVIFYEDRRDIISRISLALSHISKTHPFLGWVPGVADSASENAFTVGFTFPESVRTPCEQYLLYFGQFLKDVGVSATTDLSHNAGEVLFTVTPENPEQALDKIREALALYLRLPDAAVSAPTPSMTGTFEVQRLELQIHNLRGELALVNLAVQQAQATVRAQEATIQAQQTTIYRQSVVIDDLKMMQYQLVEIITPTVLSIAARDVNPMSTEDETVKLPHGLLEIRDVTPPEGLGVRINVAKFVEWLRMHISETGEDENTPKKE